MVADSLGRHAVVAGSHFGFHRRLRHHLGALPVSVNHARTARDNDLLAASQRLRPAGPAFLSDNALASSVSGGRENARVGPEIAL